MLKVFSPAEMNEAFANAFNRRSLEELLALYEDGAVLCMGPGKLFTGKERIAAELGGLLRMPGTMRSKNNFCIVSGDIALLRADWSIVDGEGKILAAGSSAEVLRRQADGAWRYVLDHATGIG